MTEAAVTMKAKEKREGEVKLNETISKLEPSKDGKQSTLKSENLLTAFFSVLLIAITIITYPPDIWNSTATVTSQHVWYFGWITAISTGVGVLPFFLISEPEKYWVGASNALAAGMMIAASFSLLYEGSQVTQINYGLLAKLEVVQENQASIRTAMGFFIGISFVIITKKVLSHFQGVDSTDINPANLKKMILILFVMTLHSLSEGIGIGVSFGGKSGMQLGQFISLSLAVHNMPEGLAVALVMTTRKVSKMQTVLWAIFTSLPQPIFAVPAFLFVERFAPMLPGGLGFAAGAMTYVALFELLVEAVEETSLLTTALVSGAACFLMFSIQNAVKMGI